MRCSGNRTRCCSCWRVGALPLSSRDLSRDVVLEAEMVEVILISIWKCIVREWLFRVNSREFSTFYPSALSYCQSQQTKLDKFDIDFAPVWLLFWNRIFLELRKIFKFWAFKTLLSFCIDGKSTDVEAYFYSSPRLATYRGNSISNGKYIFLYWIAGPASIRSAAQVHAI